MLEYRLNNTPLWIDESTSVVIENFNPACVFDSLQNCQALGVDIPVNPHNRALLGNPERFEKLISANDRKYTGFEIRFDGALLISGTLIIDDANTKRYSGWVQSNLGALGEEQQEKFINEMDWPTGKSLTVKSFYDDNDDDYSLLQVHNNKFWDGKGQEKELPVAYTTVEDGTKTKLETRTILGHKFHENYNDIVNNFNPSDIQEGCVISPFLHLRYVIRESLKLNKFFIDRNDMLSDFMVKNQSIYNNFNIVDIVFSTTPLTKPLWDYREGKEVEATIDAINEEKTWIISTFNYSDLLPKRSYKDFLLGIQNCHNYVFYFRVDGYVDIIDRNAIPTRQAIDIDKYLVGDFETGEQKNLRLKFTPEFDEDDSRFGENFEDLSDRWADFGDPVADMTALNAIASPAFGELRLVEDINEIYEYGWNVVTSDAADHSYEEQFDSLGWQFVSIGAQPYTYGAEEEEEKIETAISTPQRIKSPDFWELFTIPIVEQKGNIDKMRSAWNDFTLRLMPQNNLLAADALVWDGDLGLFKSRWKTWADFWKNRLDAVGTFQLPLNMYTHMQNNITEPWRTNKGNFIIEKASTEFSMHQIGETTMNVFKL